MNSTLFYPKSSPERRHHFIDYSTMLVTDTVAFAINDTDDIFLFNSLFVSPVPICNND